MKQLEEENRRLKHRGLAGGGHPGVEGASPKKRSARRYVKRPCWSSEQKMSPRQALPGGFGQETPHEYLLCRREQ